MTHEVPLESLHDSFSEEELREFDRRVRETVANPEYVVEPKFDGLSRGVGICGWPVRTGFHKRGRRDRGRRHGKYQNHSHRAQKAEGTDSLFGSTRRSIYVRRKL